MAETDIALLIPVFNAQRELERSLANLPGEDEPVHVVVVDDGSDPPIVVSPPPSPHTVSLIRLARNQGIVGALNAGLERILREGFTYVARLDAGDISLPNRFRAQKEFLLKNPDYKLIGGQAIMISPDEKELGACYYPRTYPEIRRTMHYRNCFAHPAVMIKAEVFKETGLYVDAYPAAEDYELFWRVVRRHKAANLEQFVVKYVADPQGISRKRRRQQLVSGLRLMVKNFEPWVWESYAGFAKNLVLALLPSRLNWVLKRGLCGKLAAPKLGR